MKASPSVVSRQVHLRQVAVANRCTEDWDGMRGDAAIRHCGRCRQNVYNLSMMTEAEVESFLSRGDEACVRYAYRPDGTIVTSACATGARRAPAALAAGVAGALAYSGAFAAISAVVDPSDDSIASQDTQAVQVAMGLKLTLRPRNQPAGDLEPRKPRRKQPKNTTEPAITEPAVSEPAVTDAPSDLSDSRPIPLAPPAVDANTAAPHAPSADASDWSAWWAAIGALLVLVLTIGIVRSANPAERSERIR